MRPPPSINSFNMILGALAKSNDFPTAILLVQKLQDRGIASDLFTLNTLINCCSSMGPMKLAFFVLAKILRMGYQPDTDRVLALGFQFNKVTYGTLIKRFCNLPLSSGRCSAFSTLPRRITHRGSNFHTTHAGTYTTLIHALFEKDENDMAEKLLQEMIARGLLN
ncbi:hypothetical protein AHAS_Ahas05G0233400 [Arachis hypogaea]